DGRRLRRYRVRGRPAGVAHIFKRAQRRSASSQERLWNHSARLTASSHVKVFAERRKFCPSQVDISRKNFVNLSLCDVGGSLMAAIVSFTRRSIGKRARMMAGWHAGGQTNSSSVGS